MSEPRDRDWDDELRALADVRDAYRATVSGESPPAALDATILAASRHAVGAGPRAAGRGGVARWTPPLAAAALIVLGISVAWWGQEDGPMPKPAGVREGALPEALPTETPPEQALVADAGLHGDRLPAGGEPTAAALREEAAAAPSGESRNASAESPEPSKRRARIMVTENAARDFRDSAQFGARRDRARETFARGDPPDKPSRAVPGARDGREATLVETPAAPAAHEPAASAAAEALAPAVAPAPESRSAAVAAAPPHMDSLPRGRGEAADEPSRLAAPSASHALTRTPAAADRTTVSSATARAAAPRIGRNDDGVTELREILALWEADRRDEASSALGRLRCVKPHVPIPPDLPVPSPMPLRCPDGRTPAKEAPPRDR